MYDDNPGCMYNNPVYLEKRKFRFYGQIYANPTIWLNICIDILTQLIDQKLYLIKISISNYLTQLFDLQIVTQLVDSNLYHIKNPLVIGQPYFAQV